MIAIGTDYYPEHWDEKLWTQDADKMAEVGVKVVRLAEFAWSRLEPYESTFDFDWLDRAVKIFSEHGIKIILCTPTNCPPLWLYEAYPDALQTERTGNKIATGIRGHRCYNSPSLRRLSKRIITKLLERYGDNPSVISWQLDNELDAAHCCCPTCTDNFRAYLKDKFGSLAQINKAFGNNVWSGEYSSWSQVIPPLGAYPINQYNPAFMLEWHKYCQQSVNDFVQFQCDIIRSIAPNTIITTNTWLCENTPDFYGMFENLDVASYDNYPPTNLPYDKNALYSHAFHLDLIRGIKRKNFWIMEQLSGTMGCWMPMQKTPRPNMIKGYSLQAIAHGADLVVHFRWRSAITGAEMFWHGLIDQSNRPSRRFFEFADLCKTVNELGYLEDTKIANKVAILYSPIQETTLKIQPQSDGFHYYNQLKNFHDGITALGVGCDIISENAGLSQYDVIIAPTLFVADKQVSDNLHDFCESGGTVILTNRSGVKNENNNCIMSPLPTVFSDMTGCIVDEFDSIGWDSSQISMGENDYSVTCWCDILEVSSAEILATYKHNFYADKPCITKNSYGKGLCYYVGTIGKRDFYRDLMAKIFADTGTEFTENLPQNIEITVRESADKAYTFIFNNNESDIAFEYAGETISMYPFEMRIL